MSERINRSFIEQQLETAAAYLATNWVARQFSPLRSEFIIQAAIKDEKPYTSDVLFLLQDLGKEPTLIIDGLNGECRFDAKALVFNNKSSSMGEGESL